MDEEKKIIENSEVPHKRRVRYKGTHPRNFNEKYKELNPEKYTDTVEKLRQKGKTPVGMHIPIMVNEILDFLDIKEGQIGLDATLGYGGHTTEMLKKLNHTGHIYGLDVDPVESEKTRKRLESHGFNEEDVTVTLLNFANIDQMAEKYGPFDFVLADLGVSSMQIDNPDRGFTFKREGPLDLRLDQEHGITAAERLRTVKFDELKQMLIENSDEPYADQIACEIFHRRKKRMPIETTKDLYDVIEKALEFLPKKDRAQVIKKSAQRTFQALRIDVNQEFEVLEMFLEKLPTVLKSGGRAAILTFHSGEDRRVKKAFKQGVQNGDYSEVARYVIRPREEECRRNTRATCTKFRWAIKE